MFRVMQSREQRNGRAFVHLEDVCVDVERNRKQATVYTQYEIEFTKEVNKKVISMTKWRRTYGRWLVYHQFFMTTIPDGYLSTTRWLT